MASLALLLVISGAALAQAVQFRVNLALEIGAARDTLSIGISGDGPGGVINDNTYNLDPTGTTYGPLGLYGESPAPPGDPDGNRVRMVDIPGRTSLGTHAGLFRYDFRGFTSPTQVDTFAARIDGLRVETSGVTVSWPNNLANFGSSWILYSRAGSTLTQVANMLTTTSYTFPPTGSNIQFVVIKAGAFTTEVKRIDDTTPTAFALKQNCPNPFNPSTEIQFSIPVSGHVELKVYNLLGQEVATLVNESKSEGIYSVKFDAKGLSSGVYLYRLRSANYASVRKLVLAK